MKILRHYNYLLIAACYLLLAPAMVLAGQGNWNIVDGGKIVNGTYQLKCGEGSGWQKCGEEEKQENTTISAWVVDHFQVHVPKNFDVTWSIMTTDNNGNLIDNKGITKKNYLPPGFKKRKYSSGGMTKISNYFYAADFSYYIKPIVIDGEEWFIDPELPSNKNLVPHHPVGMFSMQIFTATKR